MAWLSWGERRLRRAGIEDLFSVAAAPFFWFVCFLGTLVLCFVFVLLFQRCDTTEKLKAVLPRLEQELKDSGKFKDFYQFTFNFAKNPGQKGLGERRASPKGRSRCAVVLH